MPRLTITRGYPASGKTTWAKEFCARTGAKRISRDDLRFGVMGWEPNKGIGNNHEEERITRMQHLMINELLAGGFDVVVDDTNLRASTARSLLDVAVQVGADWEVVDITTDRDECIYRNNKRAINGERHVPVEVIHKMAQKFPIHRWPVLAPTEKVIGARYVPNTELPKAYMFDVDGTMALMNGRSPYDWHRVGEDDCNHWVANVAHALSDQGYYIVVLSGRDRVCEPQTLEWLYKHEIPVDLIVMREMGDTRRDSIVKSELFFNHIATKYNVVGCFDDRNQVVEMWRAIGVPCAQVALGDF